MPRPRAATYPYHFDSEGRCAVVGHGHVRYPWARVLMESHVGRELGREEVVHHINGDPTDDRIENLQIVSPQEHMAIHREQLGEARRKPRLVLKCAVCGSTFERLPSRVIGTAYCSRECMGTAKRVVACKRGHPRTPENTFVYKSNGRSGCRICMREQNRANRKRRSLA